MTVKTKKNNKKHKKNEFQVEFFNLAVEFTEEGTSTVVKEETSASLKNKVEEQVQTEKQDLI